MAKTRTVTIKARSKDKEGKIITFDVSGVVANLDVGETKVKFLIQHNAIGTKLTHYATGIVVGDISARRLGWMANMGPQGVPNDRLLAQGILSDLVGIHGEERILREMSQHEVINP